MRHIRIAEFRCGHITEQGFMDRIISKTALRMKTETHGAFDDSLEFDCRYKCRQL